MSLPNVLIAVEDPQDTDRIRAAANYLQSFDCVPIGKDQVLSASEDRELAQGLILEIDATDGRATELLVSLRQECPRLPVLGLGVKGSRTQFRTLRTDFGLEAILPTPLEPMEVLARLYRFGKSI